MELFENSEAFICSKRLRLKPIVESHAEAMYPVLSDRQLYEFTGDEPPASMRTLKARYRRLESRKSADASQLWLSWLVYNRKIDTPMGYVQATVTDSHTDIAWVIGLKWQDNGYASEAATTLVKWLLDNEVKCIRACVNPNHEASQRVAVNAGLYKSGVVEDGEDVWIL